MSIGNDIVDLIEYQDDPPHRRFAERTLSAEEFATYRCHPRQAEYVQLAWTAKESVYKLMRQEDWHMRFKPSAIVYSECLGLASYYDREFRVVHTENSDFIHTYACELGCKSVFFRVAKMSPCTDRLSGSLGLASQEVRGLARSMTSSLLGLDSQHIVFEITLGGAPIALAQGRILPISLSFTHHGRYVAVAITNNSQSEMFPAINMDQ